MRLAVIGPVPPFRSGIAQHTYMLARALEHSVQLLVVSFTRQYPGWLFPGESDRAGGTATFDRAGCQFVLDPLDPWTWGRTADVVIRHRPEGVVIPWWTVYWAPCIAFIAWRLRRRGIPVHFMCHNVVDHEAAWWKRTLTGLVLRHGDGFIVQSPEEQRRLRSLVTGGRVTVHPHPVFTQYPAVTEVLPRRAALELLFFGIVRPYKGLDVLLSALAQLRGIEVMLTVVGEFWGGLGVAERLIRDLGISDCVELVPRYVSDTEAANFFGRADAVVLPYLKATGSGVLGLAYHYGKPVVATRVPGIQELVIDGQTGVLVAPGSADELAEALRALSGAAARDMGPAIATLAAGLTWDSLASAVVCHVGGKR